VSKLLICIISWVQEWGREMREYWCDVTTRKPSNKEFDIMRRLVPSIPAAVINGFFYMAASVNVAGAIVFGVVLIVLSFMAYQWAVQE
jgi:hypothetical protein